MAIDYGTRLDARINGQIISRIWWESEDYGNELTPDQAAMSAVRAAGEHCDWHVYSPVQREI